MDVEQAYKEFDNSILSGYNSFSDDRMSPEDKMQKLFPALVVISMGDSDGEVKSFYTEDIVDNGTLLDINYKDTIWHSLYDGLKMQITDALEECECGYQIFTFKREYLGDGDNNLSNQLGSLIFDAPQMIFNDPSEREKYQKIACCTKNIYPSSAFLTSSQKQFVLYWEAKSQDDAISINVSLSTDGIDTENATMSIEDFQVKKAYVFADDVVQLFLEHVQETRIDRLKEGVEFLINNALLSYWEKHKCYPVKGGMIFTPSSFIAIGDVSISVSSSVFFALGKDIDIDRLSSAMFAITRSWGTVFHSLINIQEAEAKADLLRLSNTKTAIGSIMSRNGSHNIGSHVLSALSHYVGTLPDDRVLYQYIQQRMDYTATVTTDFPDWTVPTRFVANLMKTFFSQRHLLEHISESEGLEAYHFQGRNVVSKQTGKIKIHLRKFKLELLSQDASDTIAQSSLYQVISSQPTANVSVVGGTAASADVLSADASADAPVEIASAANGADASAVPVSVDTGIVSARAITVSPASSAIPEDVLWEKAYSKENSDKWTEITDYPERRADPFSLLYDDVSLAIPGGVVGQHAFYTVIENIVRNAAKHDWMKRNSSIRNLDIYIDFIDWKDNATVELTVWNNCNDLNREENKTLIPDLRKKLEQSLITSNGSLRRENWGLAEMRISTGYLQGRSTDEIGGLVKASPRPIVTPVSVPDLDHPAQCHLGYRFFIPKPKKILIVLSEQDNGIYPENDEELKKEGIYVKTIQEIISGKTNEKNNKGHIALAYEYVVLPFFEPPQGCSFDPPIKDWLMPFRILINETEVKAANALLKNKWLHKKQFDFFSGINYDNLKSQDGRISSVPKTIKNAVYKAWLSGLKEKCDIANEPLFLQIQADSSSSGGGKGLVADLDLYHVVFNECAHSVLMEASLKQKNVTAKLLTTLLALMPLNEVSFLPPGRDENSSDYIRKRLQDFCARFKREFEFSGSFRGVIRQLYESPGADVETASQINSFERIFLRNVRIDLLNGSDFVKKRVRHLLKHLNEIDRNRFGAELDVFCGKLDASNPHVHGADPGGIYDAPGQSSMLQKNIALFFGPADSDTAGEFAKLVDKLNSAYLTSDIFLRKYEENIATLPLFYKDNARIETPPGGSGSPVNNENPFTRIVEPYSEDAVRSMRSDSKNRQVIRYVRHDNNGEGLYVEALSGSQSYLNTLVQFTWSNPELVARLVENALLRVLIIDERVYNFLKNRRNELDACRKMQIYAVNVYGKNESFDPDTSDFVSVNKFNKTVNPEVSQCTGNFDISKDHYDILIIHQGIIDKWVSEHNSDMVCDFLNALKTVVPYVVVTTGRGRPDSIPDDARVLPFSTIESTIFRKYPEKLVLVNTVMNILPIKPGHDCSNAAAAQNNSSGAASQNTPPPGGNHP